MMVTHDEGKRETRARMKDGQCVSAILWVGVRSRRVAPSGTAWTRAGFDGKRQKDSNCDVAMGNVSPKNKQKEKNKRDQKSHWRFKKDV